MTLIFQRMNSSRLGILLATLVLLLMGRRTLAENDSAVQEHKPAQLQMGSYSLEISGFYETYDLAELNLELARATEAAKTSFANTYTTVGSSVSSFSTSTSLSPQAFGVGLKLSSVLESGWGVYLQSQLSNGAAFKWNASSTGTPVGTITRAVSGNVSYFPIYVGLSKVLQFDRHVLGLEVAMGPAFSRSSFSMSEERRGGSLNSALSKQYDFYGTGIASRAALGYRYLFGSSGYFVGVNLGYHLLKVESSKSAHDIDFDNDGVLDVRKDEKWLSASGIGYPVSLDLSGFDSGLSVGREF